MNINLSCKLKILLAVIVIGLMTSCSYDKEVDFLSNDFENATKIELWKPDTVKQLTQEDAKKVAMQYASRKFVDSRSYQLSVDEVVTVRDSLANNAMFIVNFSNNSGFVIVSANKSYYPILAQSEVGSFNIKDSLHPAVEWLEEQKFYISNNKCLPDEAKADIALSWSAYDGSYFDLVDSRSYEEKPAVYYDSLRMWSNGGVYRVYKFADFKMTEEYRTMTDDQLREIEANLMAYGNANYGSVEDVTVVLTRDYQYDADYPAQLIYTTWGQKPIYNTIQPDDYPLGCTTIAAGQIMRFYQWPSYYDWQNMPTGYLYTTETINQFLYDLALSFKVRFGKDNSPASMEDVKRSLINHNYIVKAQKHNVSEVIKSINIRRPVLMYNDDHAWVCDGAKFSYGNHEVRVMTLEYKPTTYNPPTKMIEVARFEKPLYTSDYLFHMNWGWFGSCDGFYRDNNLKVTINGQTHDYNNGRYEFIIYPNK